MFTIAEPLPQPIQLALPSLPPQKLPPLPPQQLPPLPKKSLGRLNFSWSLPSFVPQQVHVPLNNTFKFVVAEQKHVDCVKENLREKDIFELGYIENLTKGMRAPRQIVQDSFEKSQITVALLHGQKCIAVGGISAKQSLLSLYRMPWMVGTEMLNQSPKAFVYLQRLYHEICADFSWLANITITSEKFGKRESLHWLEKMGFNICSLREWTKIFGLPVQQKSARVLHNAKWNNVWVFYSKRR